MYGNVPSCTDITQVSQSKPVKRKEKHLNVLMLLDDIDRNGTSKYSLPEVWNEIISQGWYVPLP